ncbi:hypothetical protein AB0C59_01615 [Streptomyces sp. NPDC048664]|uniref:hypothetical protein n=1 Tax=Streptomyces sp. NPDC048664 TaxID=3154505 RepID=UPI0034498EEB
MKLTLRTRSSRALAVCAVSAALVASGATAAFAVDPVVPNTDNSSQSSSDTGSLVTNPGRALAAAIIVKTDRTQVRSGELVTLSGTTRGLKIGSPVVLQHFDGVKWVNLPDRAMVRTGSTYRLAFKPTIRGKQQYRVMVSRTMSLPVSINVM